MVDDETMGTLVEYVRCTRTSTVLVQDGTYSYRTRTNMMQYCIILFYRLSNPRRM